MLPACVVFVAPPLLAPTLPPSAAVQSRLCVTPSMGLFDGLKDAFENEPKIAKKADRTAAGKNKEVPAYVKKKEAERARIERENQARVDAKKGDKGDGLPFGFTWK